MVYHRHWDMDERDRGNPLTGWALVLTIRDLSKVLDGDVPEAGESLWRTWDADSTGLGSDRDAYDRVIDALGAVRASTHALLQSLD